MPLPSGLFVKNGSNARSATSAACPVPVSLTLRRTVSFLPRAGGDRERAARRHGVAGVEREVDQHLLGLPGVELDRRQPVVQPRAQVDVLAERAVQQALGVADDLVELQGTRRGALLAGEDQQLSRERRGAVDGAADLLEVLPALRPLG